MTKVSVAFRVNQYVVGGVLCDYVAVSIAVAKKKVVKKSVVGVADVPSKGAKCVLQGKQYEQDVANVCKSMASMHLGMPMNSQTAQELGGCTAQQDLYLNFFGDKDIGVEVKRVTPDWMQMSIAPDASGSWRSAGKTKIPVESKAIFEKLLSANATTFPKPPFLERDITYDEWSKIKHSYKDIYASVPSSTIAKAYAAKGSHYIQLHGYGLYHTGENPCNFDVPYFECEQRMRIRCKRHGKKDETGKHVPSSVMASLCPKLKTLPKSTYSLDDIKKMPNGVKLLKV